MKHRKYRNLALLSASALMLTACGGDDAEEPAAAPEEEPAEEAAGEEPAEEAAGEEPAEEPDAEAASLDCSNIEFMVPYAPGGGSDQQVRRLEPLINEELGASVNIVYREGAEGAVAWDQLHGSEPDGCTVSNVVYPNIVLAAQDAEWTADEFTHLGQTETAPQGLAVPMDSEYEDFEQFVEAAMADPGGITIGGTGSNGEIATQQISEGTGAEFTYVPMEGGVGDTIPLLVGGHVDAALFGSNHIVTHADTIRGIGLAGTEPSPALPDVPTLDSLGYEGFDFATTWGVLAPPDLPEEIAQIWNDALNAAVEDEELNATLVEGGLTPMQVTLGEAAEFTQNVIETFEE